MAKLFSKCWRDEKPVEKEEKSGRKEKCVLRTISQIGWQQSQFDQIAFNSLKFKVYVLKSIFILIFVSFSDFIRPICPCHRPTVLLAI